MREELGLPWLNARYFRIGASGLLGDISRQLEHYLSGEDTPPHIVTQWVGDIVRHSEKFLTAWNMVPHRKMR